VEQSAQRRWYAFSTLACPGWSVHQIVESAAALGYGALELRLLDGEVLDPVRDREAILQAASRARTVGIEICALDSSCQLNRQEPQDRATEVETIRRWIALAAEVRAPVVRVFGVADQPGMDAYEGTAAAAETLAAACIDAEAAGITVALETHDSYSTAARVAAVLAAVPSPAAGALWDIFHTYLAGESASEAALYLRSRIAHVHVKDGFAGADGPRLTLLGDGEAPIAESLAALSVESYAGFISVEWEKKWHPQIAEPEVALPQAISFLRGNE
jgi:fatty-acyl-CoA synthase